MKAVCAWYLLCDNDADGCVEHPTLGWVPTCSRCAEHLDLDFVKGEVLVETV